MRPAVVTDFDGTITVGEVSAALLQRFGEGDWKEAERLLFAGKISLVECMQRQFATLKSPREEMARFVRETTIIRPGFDVFMRYCAAQSIPVTICSGGMDFYIEAALGQYPWFQGVPVVTGKARFGERNLTVHFPEGRNGLDFKTTLVEKVKSEGYAAVYVGDGVSDDNAATHADFVFARDRLLALCRRKGIAHQPYEDFFQVKQGLEALISEGSLLPRPGAPS